MKNRKLVLENGKVFEGVSFGSNNEAIAELVFNTAVVGYQEILSDPSNCHQIVCMAYPVIGNYGLTDEDYESKSITVSGVIVREYNDIPSNFRYTHKLGEVMDENGVPGIAEVDTRQIVRIIRDNGTMKALICDIDKPIEECMEAINSYETPKNMVQIVSSKKVWHSRTTNPTYNVVAVDCGIKRSLVKQLNDCGCNVVVVPYNTTAEAIMKYKPTGLFISDGPGNPSDVLEVVELVKEMKGKLPILGVGLGQEIIGLAYGAKVYKQKAGHNGCNLPVKNVKTGRIEITNQNDLYALDIEALKSTGLEITHVNVLDGIPEGVEDLENSVIAIQYNPSPSLKTEDYVFDRFVKLMKKFGGNGNAKKNRY
ncbi:MAG: glutamine-hydrolyzing carbamoyl-phosphate synthase small subunit [Acholeplasmatales bacterium]|nr:glutamine-hydrolyzing carbamoyl-phosphate synthase small subunit [Acholeplasmatales bacterium]